MPNVHRKICHMTSAHSYNDTRIFFKQCHSLYHAGYDVSLIVQHEEDEIIDGIKILGITKPKNRRERILSTTRLVYKRALECNADIYHFHDPELMPVGNKLKKRGKKVIYDSHEDYPSVISSKEWIPKPLRKLTSSLFSVYEKYVCKSLDCTVTCYHWTQERLERYCNNTNLVFNFPIVSKNDFIPTIDNNKRALAFAGNISEQWHIKNLLLALPKLDNVSLVLAGSIDSSYGRELQLMNEWKYVHFYGYLPFEKIYEDIYSRAAIGVALLDYIPQCKYTIGNLSNTKFFEVLYAGLPLICTDFKLWRQIVEEYNCGICVNPRNLDEIANAIDYLLKNPDEAKKMGENGRRAVLEKYNWASEEIKLLELYQRL
jgi:glycosyltransferase involved in cell wall biosynthesis